MAYAFSKYENVEEKENFEGKENEDERGMSSSESIDCEELDEEDSEFETESDSETCSSIEVDEKPTKAIKKGHTIKKKHFNASERRRRNEIAQCYEAVRAAVGLQNSNVSRAAVLEYTANEIMQYEENNSLLDDRIELLQKQYKTLLREAGKPKAQFSDFSE